ncbi:MAG: acyltransferase family protein [Deltaproteobacteria bacterium]|nr:MAG: acyltransferase family protein [Deltaproteobacteria bacterium]
MAQERPRFFYIDNLRILLIVLVVLHHLAITYGAPGDWPYQEGQPDMVTSIAFSLFGAINDAFMMGFFFMISGFFTPGSYDRKGAGPFLRDRLLRLGVPLLFYIIVIDPLIVYALAVNVKGFEDSFLKFLPRYFENYGSLGVGPLWFVELLLIFNLLYVLWRRLVAQMAHHGQRKSRMPGNATIAIFALLLGLVTFIVRMAVPVGWELKLLGLRFPHIAQYLSLFVIGIIAYRRGWLSGISDAMAKVWLGITIITFVLLPIALVAGGAMKGNIAPFVGGFHWQSLVKSVWDQFMCMGMVVILLVWFRRRFNHQGTVAKAMSASAYTAYIIHQPVLIVLGLILMGMSLYLLAKFALVAPVALALCFLLSNYIRKLPLARRIL